MTNPNDSVYPKMNELLDKNDKENDGAIIVYNETSLTKREYFAAMAMQALLSRNSLFGFTPQQYAEASITFADALIEELNKQPEDGKETK